MKPRHIVANIVFAVVLSVLLWGMPDNLAWLVRFILVTTIFGIVGLLIYIGVRFRERPSE